jgi:hypothetical protein
MCLCPPSGTADGTSVTDLIHVSSLRHSAAVQAIRQKPHRQPSSTAGAFDQAVAEKVSIGVAAGTNQRGTRGAIVLQEAIDAAMKCTSHRRWSRPSGHGVRGGERKSCTVILLRPGQPHQVRIGGMHIARQWKRPQKPPQRAPCRSITGVLCV